MADVVLERLAGRALRRPLALAALALLALAVVLPAEEPTEPEEAWVLGDVLTVPAPVWHGASVAVIEPGGPVVRTPRAPLRSSVLALPGESVRLASDLLDVLGIDHDGTVVPADINAAGAALDVEVGEHPSAGDVERLLAAHRQSVVPALRKGGVVVPSSATEDEVRRLGYFFGIDPGDRVRASDVDRMARRAAEPSPVFASTAGVHIHAPSRHVVLVGFHQAAYAVARQLNAHDRVPMRTLPSRGRATGSRSATDVSVEPDTPILAPVSGRVVEVQRYALYGRYADARIRIVPDQNPQMLVSILHVTGPKVRVGDRIKGGRTVIAEKGTKFPFSSQIDRFAGSYPHAHVEVRRR